jgi:hypothetical protein
MAKSKAELKSDHRLYRGAICKLQRAVEEGDYLRSIRHAKDAWKHIDGMIQYESRYLDGGDFANIECIDHVLEYSPILFDDASLDEVGALLKRTRRVDRCTPVDLAGELAKSLHLLAQAYGLYRHIEDHGDSAIDDCRTAFAGDDSDFNKALRVWSEFHLVERRVKDGREWVAILHFGDAQIRAKCSLCGVAAQGKLSQFLAEASCPVCQGKASPVLLNS